MGVAMKTSKRSPAAIFLFYGVLIGVLLLNGGMTAVFGSRNLWSAFSTTDSLLPRIAGGLYALLIFDFGAIGYFAAFKFHAETKWQRFLTLSIAALCLSGSIFATIEQLASTAFGLAVFSGYTDVIEFIALVFMISLTAIHATMAAVYGLLSVAEMVRSKSINLKAEMIDDVLDEVDTRVRNDKGVIVDQLAADSRRDILEALGFSSSLERLIPSTDDDRERLKKVTLPPQTPLPPQRSLTTKKRKGSLKVLLTEVPPESSTK